MRIEHRDIVSAKVILKLGLGLELNSTSEQGVSLLAQTKTVRL